MFSIFEMRASVNSAPSAMRTMPEEFCRGRASFMPGLSCSTGTLGIFSLSFLGLSQLLTFCLLRGDSPGKEVCKFRGKMIYGMKRCSGWMEKDGKQADKSC
jgi:hypothetical protein